MSSPKVDIFNSFFSNSALAEPTPLRYSIGVSRNGVAIIFSRTGEHKNREFEHAKGRMQQHKKEAASGSGDSLEQFSEMQFA